MIGQTTIRRDLGIFIGKDTFPRFSIITGMKGSGKKTLIKEFICPQLKELDIGKYTVPDVKIESIRDMIHLAYKLSDMLFIIPDADTMSNGAKNALLKVVEEPPRNNYFIMTLEDINNTLSTIHSRAQVFSMDLYTKDELRQYYISRPAINMDEMDLCVEIADTPWDISTLIAMEPTTFYEYTQLVVDNICKTSGANSFKIADKVAIKDISEGYDLRLFWKAFIRECNDRACGYFENKEDSKGMEYLFRSRETSRTLSKLNIKGINRQMLFDRWILSIRELSYEFASIEE